MDYKIVKSCDHRGCSRSLEGEVINAIKDGWEPVGGVCQQLTVFTTGTSEFELIQAMIKRETE